MKTLNMIWGLLPLDNDVSFNSLSTYYQNYFAARIPGLGQVKFWHYTDDVASALKGQSNIVIAGHSFGGHTAVETARTVAGVDALVLYDPVRWTAPGVGLPSANTTDFIIPPNVRKATCLYRNATAAPWSAPIRNTIGNPNWANRYYPDMDHDKDAVWSDASVKATQDALTDSGGGVVPAPPLSPTAPANTVSIDGIIIGGVVYNLVKR